LFEDRSRFQDIGAKLLSKPYDAVINRYGTPRPENNAFGYFRNSERVLIGELASQNVGLGLLVGAWLEWRRKISIKAWSEQFNLLLSLIRENNLVSAELIGPLFDHLKKVMTDETPHENWQELSDEADGIKKLAKDLEKDLEDSGDGSLIKAFDGITRQEGQHASSRPLALDDSELLRRRRIKPYWVSHNRAEGDPKKWSKPYSHDGFVYYMKWTSIEWTQLLLKPRNKKDPKKLYKGDMDPLVCNTRHNRIFEDNPSLLEIPGNPALVQNDGTVRTDHHWVDWQWADRVHLWEGPVVGDQSHFIPKGPDITLYTCALNIPGEWDLDWDSLRDKLEKLMGKQADSVVNTLKNSLSGTSVGIPGLGQVSLQPLGDALGGVEETAKAIIKEILDWLILQLRKGNFPLITVAHYTLGDKNDPPIISSVTYHERLSTEKGDVDNYGKKGMTLYYDDTSGLGGPLKSRLVEGPQSASWSGLSDLPDRSMHLQNLDDVAGDVKIYRWASPEPYGAHVFVPLLEKDDKGKLNGARYAVALRTETVAVDVTFEDYEK